MGIFKNKQKKETKRNEMTPRTKTLLERKRDITESRIKKELERMALEGKTPLEMARTASKMRSEQPDELELTVGELNTSRSRVALDKLSTLKEEELQELFTEFFVNRRLSSAEASGFTELDLEDLRLSSETYVAKLMAMTPQERLIEFKRIDEEKIRDAKNSNDENIFKYILNKEVESLRASGLPEEQIEEIKKTRLIEFVIGIVYSEEMFAEAKTELEYKDLTEGTNYIIDTSHLETVEQALYLTKTEMDLQRIVSTKRSK